MAGTTTTDPEVRKLRSGSVTTKKDEVTRTVKDPETSTTITQTIGPDEAQMRAYYEQQRDPMARMYEVDPETGRYVGSVGKLLGFDPDEYKKRQEADIRNERNKVWQKDVVNALSAITKTATRAAGGHVRVDEPLRSEKNAEKVDRAKDNIAKMAAAVDQAKAGREMEFAKAQQAALQKYLDKYSQKVSRTVKEGGGSTTTKTGGGSSTTSWSEHVVTDPSAAAQAALDAKKTAVVKLYQRDAQGNPVGYRIMHVTPEDATAYAATLSSTMEQLFRKAHDNDDATLTAQKKAQLIAQERELTRAGVYTPSKEEGNRWDYTKLNNYGISFFDSGLTTQTQQLWTTAREYTGSPLNISTRGVVSDATQGNGTQGAGTGTGSGTGQGTEAKARTLVGGEQGTRR